MIGGVDLIVDQVSGKAANQNLAATKIKGRIVNVGRLGGTRAEFNFDLHAARRIRYIGVTFRTRTIEEIHDIFDEVRKDIWGAGRRWAFYRREPLSQPRPIMHIPLRLCEHASAIHARERCSPA